MHLYYGFGVRRDWVAEGGLIVAIRWAFHWIHLDDWSVGWMALAFLLTVPTYMYLPTCLPKMKDWKTTLLSRDSKILSDASLLP
jgi:hypothetical protein